MADRDFQTARQAFIDSLQGVVPLEVMYLGDAAGNKAVTGDPARVWMRDRAGNLSRVNRGDISLSLDAGTPFFVGETAGMDNGYPTVQSIAYPQISNYGGESGKTAFVGGAGAVAYADSEGNVTGDATHFLWNAALRQLFLTQESESNGNAIWFDTYSNSQNSFLSGRRARDTEASPDPVQSGDVLFRWSAFGYGTTGFSAGSTAKMDAVASETHSDTAHGTKINFSTTPNATTSSVNSVTIEEDGLLEMKFGGAINRNQASGAVTIPTGYSMVVAGYYSLTGSASLSLAGDAEMKVI